MSLYTCRGEDSGLLDSISPTTEKEKIFKTVKISYVQLNELWKKSNESYSYTQRKIHVSLQNHLPGPGWKHSFPKMLGVWLLADSCPVSLSQGPAIPEVMPPIEARLSQMTGLWRPRPGLLSGELTAPKHAMGSAEDFTARRLRCLSDSAAPVGPPSPTRPRRPRSFAVNFPHTRLRCKLCSPGTEMCPRPSLRGLALAPVLSLERSCFEKLFWHILSNISTCLWLKEESVLA